MSFFQQFMKRFRRHSPVRHESRSRELVSAALAVGFVLLTVVSSTSRGALIEYAWQGSIVPNDPAEDPWGIGALGLRFTISGFADQAAADIDAEVGGAFFELTDTAFLIDGVQAAEFNDGTIWFQELGGSDAVSISSDDVMFNGIRDGFLTFVALPKSTFTFMNAVETPPVFSPAMMLSRQGAGTVASSYGTFVDGGVVVTATLIPEPATFALSVLAALGAGVTLRRRRIR